MKRPVWRYSLETTSNAPLAVVKARLAAMQSPLPLSVCAPRLGGKPPTAWRQQSLELRAEPEGGLRLEWNASMGGLQETASLVAHAVEQGCRLRVEGRLKGWPLLWKLGLLGWRSEGLLERFVHSL
jgi:hypothetical protein